MAGNTGYSDEAGRQLQDLGEELSFEIGTICEQVLSNPDRARARSATIRTPKGTVFRFSVPGHYPYKIFWMYVGGGVRIEAVFRYPG